MVRPSKFVPSRKLNAHPNGIGGRSSTAPLTTSTRTSWVGVLNPTTDWASPDSLPSIGVGMDSSVSTSTRTVGMPIPM